MVDQVEESGWPGRGTHNRDPGSSGPMKRAGDATWQGVDMDYGVSFQHLTLLGADAASGSGDLSFSSENPACTSSL